MKWVTLKAASDEYGKSLGLALAGTTGYEGFMADRGEAISLIAHDIIEHQNGLASIGPVWDEMEAMGGIWHCRGRWGDIGNGHRSAEENIAADFMRMGCELSFRGFDELGPTIREPESDWEDAFHQIIEETRKGIRHEMQDEDWVRFPADLYYDQMLHRLRRGYRKAKHRFGEGFESLNQFHAISREVQKACAWIDYEGQEFRLGWGKGKCVINPIPGIENW